jgi:hypothetical protein
MPAICDVLAVEKGHRPPRTLFDEEILHLARPVHLRGVEHDLARVFLHPLRAQVDTTCSLRQIARYRKRLRMDP